MRIGSTHAAPFVLAACLMIVGVTLGQCPTPAVTSYPWIETFDAFGATDGSVTPPPNWTQDTADATGVDSDWIFKNTPTPSTGTGPTVDHTTGSGFYMYVEDSGVTYSQVNIITPCLDLSSLAFPRLQFWVHSNNSTVPTTTNENFLNIDIIAWPGPAVTSSIISPIGHIGPNWTLVQVDLTMFSGTTIQVQFRGQSLSSSFTHDIAIDDVQVDDGPTNDVGVSSVVSPLSPMSCGTTLGAFEIVTVNVTNYGLVTLPTGTMIPLQFSVDGGAQQTATMTVGNAIGPFSSQPFTFPQTADFSGLGLHNLTAATVQPGDQDPTNDSFTEMVNHGTIAQVSSYPYMENFDNFGAVSGQTAPPQCWTQDPIDAAGTGPDTDWIFDDGTAAGQPPSDHTTGTGFFAFVEDASSHPNVNLESTELDLTPTTSPGVRFWVYSNNTGNVQHENFLHIDVIDVATQMLFQDVIPPIGHQGPTWVQHQVSLALFSSTVVKVIFRGESNGGGALHNIAIDDFEAFDTAPGPGQFAQGGVAEFDINTCKNANGFLAQPGEPGPFFADARAGDLFTITYRGEPNQPFILLAGDLTPGVLPIPVPGIGQVDVGGPLNGSGDLTTLQILLIGIDPTGLNPFANTTSDGEAFFQFVTPSLALGVLTSFQAAIYNSVSVISFSNAVEVTIVP